MKTSLLIGIALSCCTITHAQTSYEEYVESALKATYADSLDKAEALFKEALKQSPADHRNSLIYFNLGKIQTSKGLYDKAIESYSLALNNTPLSVPILMARANLYLQLGNNDKAYKDYCNVLDTNPDNTDALAYRAFINKNARRYDQARMDYERLLNIEPDHYLANLGMALICQDTHHLHQALERMEQLINIYPDKAELYSIRADMEAELAIMDLDKAVELNPQNSNYVLARAYLHLERGDKHLARKDFETAISLGVPRSGLREELKQCK